VDEFETRGSALDFDVRLQSRELTARLSTPVRWARIVPEQFTQPPSQRCCEQAFMTHDSVYHSCHLSQAIDSFLCIMRLTAALPRFSRCHLFGWGLREPNLRGRGDFVGLEAGFSSTLAWEQKVRR
jgi:hypothetical protein